MTLHMLHQTLLASLRPLLLAVTLVPALAFVVPAPSYAQQHDPHVDRGRMLTRAFYEGDIALIVDDFNDDMRTALGGEGELASFRERVLRQLGQEAEVLGEEVDSFQEHSVYRRTVRLDKSPEPFLIMWSFDADGRVAGFSIQPEGPAPVEAPSPYLDYRTQAELRLPFDGVWSVAWDGRRVEENYHAAYADQRFAYDLVVERDGRRHHGAGRSNDDYHCWGRAVLAPAAGVVVTALAGIEDNTPGEMNSSAPPGNHVVLDHGNDEFSFLAHLRYGSVRVERGEHVEAGDTLGACGNSGNSSEPHLHYHLQNSPDFGDGKGLPAQFLDYVADEDHVTRDEPTQGQRIRPLDTRRRRSRPHRVSRQRVNRYPPSATEPSE